MTSEEAMVVAAQKERAPIGLVVEALDVLYAHVRTLEAADLERDKAVAGLVLEHHRHWTAIADGLKIGALGGVDGSVTDPNSNAGRILGRIREIRQKVVDAQGRVEGGGANEQLTAATILLSEIHSMLGAA